MNTFKALPCLLAIAFAASASAKVTLEVPSSVNVLVVDGAKPHESGNFLSSTKTIEVPNGEHQVVFRYQAVFSEGQERVSTESDAIIAKFKADDTTLKFDMPKYRDATEAKKHIDTMKWSLVDADGNAVSVKQDKLIKEGMQIGRNYRDEINQYNIHGGVAAVYVSQPAQPRINYNTTTPAPAPKATPGDNTAEQMLHFWYDKADAQARARFKEYLSKH
ncbi:MULTISPECIES: DUF2057 family protein [Vibrio]|uniref:UPF0319 protein F9817_15365 n=2 Tax=Vibrio TaxID=662 RepID=A0A7X4LMX4_9VIBR|nr:MULTISPECIES: DUF2057 family protein [Vibrio]MBF9003453.1 DUF2057 family protein [Vibrio nitrifigilis]MZI94572.1 DUF2057 domain-containing protein [Vibrio eleionomae]